MIWATFDLGVHKMVYAFISSKYNWERDLGNFCLEPKLEPNGH